MLTKGLTVRTIDTDSCYYGQTGVVECIGVKPIVDPLDHLIKLKFDDGCSYWYTMGDISDNFPQLSKEVEP